MFFLNNAIIKIAAGRSLTPGSLSMVTSFPQLPLGSLTIYFPLGAAVAATQPPCRLCALLTQPYMDKVPLLLCSLHGDSQQQKLCHWITFGFRGEITNALWSSSKRMLKLQSERVCVKSIEHNSPPPVLSCRDWGWGLGGSLHPTSL